MREERTEEGTNTRQKFTKGRKSKRRKEGGKNQRRK